ncbi:MAG: UvrD-helicase domain-containing protein [bacterium]
MPGKEKNIKVAISSDFLNGFSKIPRKQQGKVLEFVNKFRSDPGSPGINYEKIQQARDQNLRSVRIDQSYRGIVLKPETGNVYVLLWVDHHDEAYTWSKNKLYHIHPDTGSLQVIDTEETEAARNTQLDGSSAQDTALFAGIRDRHLLRLGVPEILLPLVRSLKTEEDLDRVAEYFPQEAYEALFFLAAGFSLEEVFQELEKSEEQPTVDTSDYGAALDTPDSKRRFFVVEDELELEAILHAPLEKWRVFLHPSQRKLVEREWNGAVRVLGGAGTGKTVVAMHRARWLAQNGSWAENDRILFTTFTRNLAADIRENLSKICSEEALRRIEVVNLDRWVSNFLRQHGYNYEIDYGRRIGPLWEKSLDMAPHLPDLPSSFYREEWERIIQPQEITSLGEYMKASRIGRGVRLNRKMRKAIWPVFEEYRLLLNEQGLREGDDAMRDARLLLETKGHILPYRAIIVDEAQDMGPQAFQLIRQMIPEDGHKNDIFMVGDAHQRIYRHKVVLSRCGLNIRGRSRKLRINYRTTDETRRWALCLLEGVKVDDLDGGVDDQKGYKSLLHGALPEMRHFNSFRDEVDFISRYIRNIDTEGSPLNEVCLVARTNELLKQYESALREKGLSTCFIRRSEPDDRRTPGLRLATMHRVKGLEFDRVLIAGVNEGIMPYQGAGTDSSDPVVRREFEVNERALLYVAATRAKKEVVVTSFGKASRFI